MEGFPRELFPREDTPEDEDEDVEELEDLEATETLNGFPMITPILTAFLLHFVFHKNK